ncbi:N-acetylglucosamine-6-phosphate deacetylase [Yoonia sp. 208BN28-4]|uniref:N-acetylglucosamine-6-phosphate deacetylase n=1 Tax=Yoonia sp. 208BN28-4 TaxID=3126505 RepID=UPI0030AE7FC5
MKGVWLTPSSAFDGADIITGRSYLVNDGQVTDEDDQRADAIALQGCLTPGFVDLQVNGGGGVMLNATPTADGIKAIAAAHRQFGTTHILPTVITDDPTVLDRAATAAIDAYTRDVCLGLHIEGPHIAMARRGTHDPAFIRPLDDTTITIVQRLRDKGVPVKITLAPEAATPAQITLLAGMGAIVSLGHTDATAEMVEAAIAAGATCATHLFNAMSQMQGRSPGAVGAVLGGDIAFGIICDGHHVDNRMIRLALRAAGPDDRAFLVSDAMATVGGPPAFELYGKTITLEDGRLVNADGNLAGAHTTMAEGVQRLTGPIGVDLSRALRMAVTTPAGLIGAPHLARLVGQPAQDVLILDHRNVALSTLADHIIG